MALGRSGAQFSVRKYAGGDGRQAKRLRAQYMWLKKMADIDEFTNVFFCDDVGYSMELLERNPVTGVAKNLLWIGETLQKNVWNDGMRRSSWQPGQTLCWLESRTGVPDWLLDLCEEIEVEEAASDVCNVHGDPTVANILWRDSSKQRVLSDPVPDIFDEGKALPTRAFDLGKMLQSAWGYEDVAAGVSNEFVKNEIAVDVVRSFARTPEEWQRARFWWAAHLVLLQKYHNKRVGRAVQNVLDGEGRDFVEGRKLLVLDRDGTLTHSSVPPRSTMCYVSPWAIAAVNLAIGNGYAVAIATNQPEIARGTLDESTVNRQNLHVAAQLNIPVQNILVCPHDVDDNCKCRKPGTELVDRAVMMFDANPSRSVMMGDRVSDCQAGRNLGRVDIVAGPRELFDRVFELCTKGDGA